MNDAAGHSASPASNSIATTWFVASTVSNLLVTLLSYWIVVPLWGQSKSSTLMIAVAVMMLVSTVVRIAWSAEATRLTGEHNGRAARLLPCAVNLTAVCWATARAQRMPWLLAAGAVIFIVAAVYAMRHDVDVGVRPKLLLALGSVHAILVFAVLS